MCLARHGQHEVGLQLVKLSWTNFRLKFTLLAEPFVSNERLCGNRVNF